MFQTIAAEKGWTLEAQVDVLLQYIENQNSSECFETFLSEYPPGHVSLTARNSEPFRLRSESGEVYERNQNGSYSNISDPDKQTYSALDEIDFMWEAMEVTARFHPQAWVNDYAIDADPDGPVEFDVTPEVMAMGEDMARAVSNDTGDSDNLRDAMNAPAWIKEWSGPFWIEVEDSIEEFFSCDAQKRS